MFGNLTGTCYNICDRVDDNFQAGQWGTLVALALFLVSESLAFYDSPTSNGILHSIYTKFWSTKKTR